MTDDRKEKYSNILNLYNKNLIEDAKAKGLEYLKEFTDDFQVNNILGAISVRTKNLKDAEVFFLSAIKNNKNFSGAYNNLGLVYRELGKLDKALKCFEICIEQKEDYKEAYNNLGITENELGNADNALIALNKSIDIDKNYDQPYYNIGNICLEKENNEEAVKYFEKCLNINPNHYDCLLNIANAYTKLNKFGKSIQFLEKAIILDNNNANAYFNLGNTYYNLGKIDISTEKYKEALDRNPENYEIYIRLGVNEKELGNRSQAKEYFLKAYSFNKNHSSINYQLGMLYYEDKEDIEALKYFKNCHDFDSQERALLSYYRLKDYDKFSKKFQKISESKKDSRIIASIANHYSYDQDIENKYNFCKEPFKYIYKSKIPELNNNSILKKEILSLINKIEVNNRKSGVVKGGIQSTGNLLERKEQSFFNLSQLIKNKISDYLSIFSDQDDLFILNFPKDPVIKNSWFIKLSKGGHLNSHIHHLGWLSGAVYLKIPEANEDSSEGNFVAGIMGDNYPTNKKEYPELAVKVEEGDIVLFPSCLFHRTIPFNSDEERICIAFDIGIRDKIFF